MRKCSFDENLEKLEYGALKWRAMFGAFALGVILLSSAMTGCSSELPYVTIVNSNIKHDLVINVGNDYEFWDYEKKLNDDGSCCVIINFIRKED